MDSTKPFSRLSPTDFADAMNRDRVMDPGIRPMWSPIPRIAGPAFPVRCEPGDNLMLHAAIYRAPAASVIVVEAGDMNFAVSGGNVCAVAKKQGIAGFVVDGVIRDIAEVRENGFPVFARGIVPKPGGKNKLGVLNGSVKCGGVTVLPGDMIIADEEGIAVVPRDQLDEVLAEAQARADSDAAQTLDDWEKQHRQKIDKKLQEHGLD
jgi:4-hydroxy-4-methyl-2-oxoglutarate aldolase